MIKIIIATKTVELEKKNPNFFNFPVYSLILKDLLTDLKATKYTFSESFKEAIASVFIWHLNTFGSKQLGNGFHQFSNLAFSMTSAANRHKIPEPPLVRLQQPQSNSSLRMY